MPLTGLSLEMYIFHFEAISLSTHISGSKRPIFTINYLFTTTIAKQKLQLLKCIFILLYENRQTDMCE
jgi:hypothetical protein